MVKVISTNITSPIGWTTEQNFQAYCQGGSALRCYCPEEPYAATLFTDEQRAEMHIGGFTHFESMVIRSVEEALSRAPINLSDARTLFVLSTTKANVAELCDTESGTSHYLPPGETALKIARHLGFTTAPIVVSNACISGVSAQLIAMRLLEAGVYDKAVVCGADTVSEFTISGFRSFMSLSPLPCRPFDLERTGLNLGEAAATMILTHIPDEDHALESHRGEWTIVRGAATNDAYHLSAPHPKGEGLKQAIQLTLRNTPADSLATVNAHGTATMFNDQMESKAVEQCGLSAVWVSAYKGCFGHTLGASGLLETILTLRALDDHLVLPVRGFEEKGVSGRIHICKEAQHTERESFLKITSGFGGCNAAMLYTKQAYRSEHQERQMPKVSVLCEWKADQDFSPLEAYKQSIGDYPRFYKMDKLSQAAFVATELLLSQAEEKPAAIILLNRSSSILSDRKHLAILHNEGLASPSTFLYTLPNIMLGEIAIRHHIQGETSLYILDQRNEELMKQVVEATLSFSEARCILTGWIECPDEQHIEVDLKLLKAEGPTVDNKND